MPPHFSAVTVTACLAASLLHLRHMMQEDVRLLCLPLCGSVCVCVFQRVCAFRTVGVCGWLFVLNGHLYSSFTEPSCSVQTELSVVLILS